MRRRSSLPVLLVSTVFAAPGVAQEVALGVFTTVGTVDAADFEAAARDHSGWHADRNDTQAWAVYQAMTGTAVEYVFVAPNMTWATLDAPSVDMMEDQGHWAESAAQYARSEDIQLWMQLTAVSNPLPDAMIADYGVIRVVEFEILPGGDGAFQNGIRMFGEAMAAQSPQTYFVWNRVISADQRPTAFIAVWAPSFEALGAPTMSPLTRMAQHFGAEAAGAASDAFNASVRTTADRIWLFRPDLSYFPGG